MGLSESVYLDLVSADGLQGLVVRIARFPETGVSWLWGHVFHEGQIHGFVDQAMACDASETDLARLDVAYRIEGQAQAVLARTGPQDEPVVCLASAALRSNQHGPNCVASTSVELHAAFAPSATPVHSLEGRTEVLGEVLAEVSLDATRVLMRGRGHFHEQVQRTPRFTAPFTYATLRGDGVGAIFIRGPRGLARGSLIEGDHARAIVRVGLGKPGGQRLLQLELDDGETLGGTLHETYRYEVPIGDRGRPGTLVTGQIDGRAVTGCVNDYLLDDRHYETRA